MVEVTEPAWLNKTDIYLPTAQKYAPIFSLPDGRIHTTINRRSDQNSLDIIGRAGIIAVMDFRDDNRKYNFEWTHSAIFGNAGKPADGASYGAQNLTKQDCINVARTIGLNVIEMNEVGEGHPWGMPYWCDQKRWFYEERIKMYQDAGKAARIFGTYGGFEYFNGDPWLFKTDGNQNVLPNSNNAPFKGYIQTVQGARNSCAHFALFEAMGIGAIVKNYADTADYASDYYRKKFACEVMGKGGGRVGGIGGKPLVYLSWGNYEALGEHGPGSLHNGWNFQRTKPDGSVVTQQGLHPAVSYDWLMACDFICGFCLTDGCTPFNERIIFSTNPADNNYPQEALSYQNSTFEAAYRYSQTSRTEGQPWQHCRFKINGGDWIEPQPDGTTTLDRASMFGGPYAKGNPRRGGPDSMFRIKGNAIDFWMFDPSRGMETTENITIEPVPGKTFSVDLRGSKLRQFRETI